MTTPAISDEKFMGIVETILHNGGEWKMSLSTDGCFLTYAGETHTVSEKHANIMFTCAPRKCAPVTAAQQR